MIVDTTAKIFWMACIVALLAISAVIRLFRIHTHGILWTIYNLVMIVCCIGWIFAE